ncbi:hypothetical protein [Erythrobacter sp. Alg231-14]|uniref:hypothetical protein n=1 Tax=Erythrobacter sp. Alg231-14 TaxID=1922225 RepID=UPI000D561018
MMMNNPQITQPVAPQNSKRSMARNLWMGSASVIAGAVALSTGATPAYAQAAPGSSASGVQVTAQDRFEARRAGSRGRNVGRGGAMREVPADLPGVQTVRPLPQTQQPTPALQPNLGGSLAAPIQTQVTVGEAPTIPTVQIDPSLIVPTGPQVSLQSNSVERAIIAEPGVAGNNVRAFAVFDDVQIDFNPGTSSDQVNVLADAAIINWTTFDAGSSGGEVTFLGAGGVLDFTSSLSDYTVLNRVMTPGFDSAIRIDGDINSSVFGGSSAGGNIWFYSAGGIIVGDTGSFNVGSLLLTTSDIDPADVNNGAFDVTFTGTSDSASSIVIAGGASLRANNPDSYIALVAPRIEQNGTVTADGSIAYVAAEQATMTIDNGLFDISVAVGTEDANGIVHSETGSTGGASSTGVTDEQAIYFVAVPKNDAISMLVGGSVGYDAAASASISNGRVILTTGNNVERESNNVFISGLGFVDIASNNVDTTVDGGPAGNVTIENVEFTSDTDVFAEGSITLQAGVTNAADSVIVDGSGADITNLSLTAGDSVDVNVTREGLIDVSGFLDITAHDGRGNGGTVNVNVNQTGSTNALFGGTLSVGGSLNIDASGSGLDDTLLVSNNGGSLNGTDGFGGDVTIDITDDGIFVVGGNLDVDVSANGGRGFGRHGSSTGGDVTFNIDGGFADITGDLIIDALGRNAGTLDDETIATEGSDSTGGNVTINLIDGSLNADELFVLVGAEATRGDGDLTAQSNDATAGDFTLAVTGGSHTLGSIGVGGSTEAANAFLGGDTLETPSGRANRGLTSITVENAGALLTVTGDVSITGEAFGDVVASRSDAVEISVVDANASNGGGLVIGGELRIDALTEGGALGVLTRGAEVGISTDNGLLSADGLDLNVQARRDGFFGGGSGQGTDFEGGRLTLLATNGGTLEFDGASSLNANGTGGAVEDDSGAGIGRGGTITILADDGTISFGDNLRLNANGFAFSGVNDLGESGEGIGGTVDITVQGSTGNLSFVDIDAGTDGSFEFDGEVLNTFFSGDGSTGTGGQTNFNVLGGTLTAVDITVSSDGEGGPGGELSDGSIASNGLFTIGDGGEGVGGQVTFNIDGGDASVDNLTVTASGIGGDGAFGNGNNDRNAGDGGSATGGTATFNALSGDLSVTGTLSVEATGNRESTSGRIIGGDGGNGFGSAGGNGGSSVGGNAVFNLIGTANISAQDVVVSTQAFGGEGGDSDASFSGNPDMGGGDGGDATGGDALFNDTAGDLSFGTLTVNASGLGGIGGSSFGSGTGDAVGNGGAGGVGTGGSAIVSLNQDDADAKNYSVISRGVGGAGGQGAAGGIGGMGLGGSADLLINNVSVVFDQLLIDAGAVGGAGGFIDGQLVSAGADGGEAEGGDAQLAIAGSDANFQANNVMTIAAGATGGEGQQGSISFDDERDGGDGGAGGNATGGSATIVVSDNADIVIDADAFSFNTDSSGGAGGNGGGNFGFFTGRPGSSNVPLTSVSGDGGAGGTGTAGAVGIIATSGANVTISSGSGPMVLSAIGSGGLGGEGGEAFSRATAAGDGGVGGGGIGGSPLLRADGGTITISDVTLIAQGGGAAAGDAGDNDVGGPSGLGASGGIGIGGTPLIEALGVDGQIILGNVSVLANGTGGEGTRSAPQGIGGGGQVTIRDLSDDPAGIQVNDLSIDATGDTAAGTGLITIASESDAITVDGDLTADVSGDIEFTFEGDGQIVVTGAVSLTSSGNMNVDHQDQADGINSIDVGTTFTAVALGDFSALDNGNINSTQAVSITAENISYDNITTTRTVDLTATNGSITGTSTGTISAANVLDAIDLVATENITFGTLISTTGNVDVDAGDDVTGGQVLSAQFVNIDAGGTITVDTVDNSANAIGLVTINGGAIDIGTINAGFITNLTTSVGDLVVDTLTTSATADLDSAGSIELGTADTGSFVANAQDDFTVDSVTTTGGTADLRITAGGTASYTNLDSDRLIQIDADQILGGDLEADSQVTFNASQIDVGDITTREVANIVLTTDTGGIATGALDVSQGIITINSAAEADIASADASASIGITSGDNLTIGDVNAGGNLSINVGGDLSSGLLFAGTTSPGLSVGVDGNADIDGATTNGLLDIVVGGALTGGDFVGQGALSSVTIDATSIDIGSAQSNNQGVNITAIDAANVGNAVSALSTAITGASVNIDSGDVGGNLTVTSSAGDVTGLGSILVGGTADFTSAANIAIGTLEANNIDLTAAGDLRFNGLVSPNAITLSAINGTIGATTPGEGDIDSGGAVDLIAEDIDLGDIDSDGSITANATVGDASFGALNAGTFIDITAKGSPSVESVTSGGNVTLTGSSISLDGGDIGGSLILDALDGDIVLSFDGTQQLLVGGSATFNATGDMIVTHTNNAADTVSVDIAQGTIVFIRGAFNSGPGSIFDAGIELILNADGNVTANDLRAIAGIDLTSGGNVVLNNATVVGPQGVSNLRGITVRAGFIDFGSGFSFDNIASATITGEVTSYADINITAGGNAVFASGSVTAADNALIVNTGDDIIVEAGAMLSAANNPTDAIDPLDPFEDGPNLILNAGGEQNLLSIPSTPIASLIIDGTLNANDAAIVLQGNAIEGLDSTLIAGSIQVDVRDAPNNTGFLSDDDGLLTGPCLEGFACLGDMEATGRIEIGQSSNNDIIGLFIEQATVTATDILITTRNDIVMGTNGIDTQLNATGTFSATSNTGNVDLRDASISADQILVDAAGSLLGTGVLSSSNDIGVTVGDSIIVGGIITDGELTEVADVGGAIEGFYSVNGDFVAGIFSQGSADIDLFAGGDIDIGEASSPDSIFLSANGVFLGNASVPGDIFIDGASIGYDSLFAGGTIAIDGGGIFGGDLSAFDVELEGDQIDVGNIDADNLAQVIGSSIAVGDVTADQIDLISDSDILFNRLQSTNSILVTANDGRIAANTGPGDIVSDGDVALSAQEIAIGNVTSQGSVSADASAGDATFGVVDAANDITITASGSPSVLNAISGGDTSITGASVTFDNGTIGGNLTLNATDGDIDGNGAVSVGGAIDLTAAGNVGFGVLEAAGGSFSVDAGGDVSFTSATSTDFIDIAAGGAVLGGDLDAANDVSVDADSIAVGDVIADQISLTSATDILFNLIQSPNAISLSAVNGLIGKNTGPGDIVSDSDVTLLAEFISVNLITAGGAVTATATGSPDPSGGGGSSGPVVIGGGNDAAIITSDIDAGGVVTLTAVNGPIVTGDIDAASNIIANGASIDMGDIIARGPANGGFGGGTIDLDATGDITFGDASSQGNFNIDAGGDIGFDTIETNFGSVTANAGGAITFVQARTVRRDGSPSAQNISLNAGSDITASGTIETDDTLSLTSGGDIATGDLAGALGVGQVNVLADGTVTIGNVTSANTITQIRGTEVSTGALSGGGISITATDGSLNIDGAVTGQQGVTLSATQDVNASDVTAATSATITGVNLSLDTITAGSAVTATGDTIEFTSIDAGSNATITANAGALGGVSVSAGDTANLTAGDGAITLEMLDADTANLSATGVVSVEDAVLSGLLTAEGTSIDISSSDNLNVDVTATAGDISVRAANSMAVNGAVATGDIELVTDDGNLTIVTGSGQNITLVSEGDVDIDDTVDAVGTLTVDAVGSFNLSGTATAQSIEVTSADIGITSDGILGDATRTQSITLNTNGDVSVGGDSTDNPPPFLLDSFEFSRMFSGGDIVINAFSDGSTGGSILTLDTLNVIAGDGSSATGQNIGQSSALILNSDGDVFVIGNATITGATADTTLMIDAINLVRLDTELGGLFVFDANGGLAGEISIAATDFIAATDTAFDDIQGLSVADVDIRLGESDGVDRPDGVIRADVLDIATTASQVFIQNTVPGVDFDQRRGFDVNTLNISSGSGTGSLQPIVINGVISGATGISTIPLANLASALDPTSTINGCVIANPASCSPTTPVTPTPTDPDDSPGGSDIEIRDLIEEGIEPRDVIQVGTIEAGLIDMRPDGQFETDPLIDDPVTGAGNEDLWVGEEESEEEDEEEDS